MTESLISTKKNVIKLCLPLAAVSFILFICGYIYNGVEKLALSAAAVFSILVTIIAYCYAAHKAEIQTNKAIYEIKEETEKIAKIHYALHLASPKAKLVNKITFGLQILSEMMEEPTFCCYLCRENKIEFISATRNSATNKIEVLSQNDPAIIEITAKINSITDYDNIKQSGFTKPLTLSEINKASTTILPIDFYSKVYGILVKTGESRISEESETKILKEFCKGLAIIIDGEQSPKTPVQPQGIFRENDREADLLADELYSSMEVSGFPSLPSWSLAKYYAPSTNRADFMDYLDTSTDKQLIILGKCSGKGLSAAMYINRLKLMIRCFIDECPTPADLLNKLSTYLSTDLMPDNFIDMIALQISSVDSLVTVAIAGNTIPIVNRTRNGFAEIPQLETGIPLGLFNQGTEPYKNQFIQITPGDGIILHTDGITDFPAKGKERITKEDIKNVLDKLPEQDAEGMLGNLVKEITGKNSGEVPEEDHSIIFLKAE